ncbi:Pollen receptor-like kinase 4 [Nymphaea thermarum]|nr:Pollen receptor-like kinase 4 [Nymphaea thermarum]
MRGSSTRMCKPPSMSPLLSLARANAHLHAIVIVVVVWLAASSSMPSTDALPESDSPSLLKLKASLANTGSLADWDASVPPCKGNSAMWTGLRCVNGSVTVLQLEGFSLGGTIDVDALAGIPSLYAFSFMNNNLSGPIPDFRQLSAIRGIFLANNHFSGTIPADYFAGMEWLRKVWLSGNNFSGQIPTSLASSPRLRQVRLDHNNFSGEIPDFRQPRLLMVDVSNNDLEGEIPAGLKNMSAHFFEGNKALCGPPLQTECPLQPAKQTTVSSVSASATFAIVIAALVAAIGAGIVLRGWCTSRLCSKKVSSSEHAVSSMGGAAPAPEGAGGAKKNRSRESDSHGLIFVRSDRKPFDLQDLLGASAEVLGSGNFGSSYKAVLLDGCATVVKRYKEMNNLGREEFQEHMRALGRLRHPNVLPLLAYYYRREEKLLVYDCVENGSLAYFLHGKHTSTFTALSWPTRLKIIKGVARGLAYLYTELPNIILPHGHLKSSNVLLDDDYEPLLTDYGLAPVINTRHAAQLMLSYKAPECASKGHATNKSDVWSFGVLVLEILTGKIPSSYLRQGTGTDLPGWVRSMLREEQGGVFDEEMGSTEGAEGEMMKLLQIGLACCEEELEYRLEIREALRKIENVKEKEDGIIGTSYGR